MNGHSQKQLKTPERQTDRQITDTSSLVSIIKPHWQTTKQTLVYKCMTERSYKDRQTDKNTYIQTDRQTDRQTDT